ncbi:family 10 glycosylhydrolase [Candidatus Sumerlaeota bacterium]|nr:family 10 glycosylhydrolase [Candidatus Sumerlaeota bacterium]
MIRFTSFLLVFLLGSVAVAQSDAPRREHREIRALWVTRWDFKTPEDVETIVRNAASVEFNRLYFQVRGEASCYFRSAVEPWTWELSGDVSQMGKDPGWDPLATAIREAHARGLELHAYTNVLPAWKKEFSPPRASNHVYACNPDWIMVDSRGRRMTPQRHDFYAFLNPAHPRVRTHLVLVFGDLARRYRDLDGIHLDYLRYPSEVGEFSYDPVSLEAFRRQTGARSPQDAPEQWSAWRCAQISATLAEIGRAIREANPKLEISAAVYAAYPEAVEKKGQRSLHWAETGLVDTLVPMAYEYREARYRSFLETFLGKTRPTKGWVVVGIWPAPKWRPLGYDDAMLVRQIELARASGADGIALFAYSEFFPDHRPNRLAGVLKKAFSGAK